MYIDNIIHSIHYLIFQIIEILENSFKFSFYVFEKSLCGTVIDEMLQL